MILDYDQQEIIRKHLTELLDKRAYPKTICPSEVARALTEEELQKLNAYDWRDTMEDVRALVWEMREYGDVEVLQKGKVVRVKSLENIEDVN
ncbi:hypothetical protein N0V90_000150 [Kalmusia sp. IMI 367209]|nr:hypothetical protein N0V90_000150 [Kalmusia sp. IMI 367209]